MFDRNMPSVRLISKFGVRRFGLLLPGLALLALVSGIAGFRKMLGCEHARAYGTPRILWSCSESRHAGREWTSASVRCK